MDISVGRYFDIGRPWCIGGVLFVAGYRCSNDRPKKIMDNGAVIAAAQGRTSAEQISILRTRRDGGRNGKPGPNHTKLTMYARASCELTPETRPDANAYDGLTCQRTASVHNTGVWKSRALHFMWCRPGRYRFDAPNLERRWLSVSKVLLKQWYLRSDAASQIRPTRAHDRPPTIIAAARLGETATPFAATRLY